MKLPEFEQLICDQTSLYAKISKAIELNPTMDINELVAIIWKLDSLPFSVHNASEFTKLARNGQLTQIETIQLIRNNLS
jgi:hypothetical protein